MPSNRIPRKIAQRRHEAALPGPCHLPTLHTLPRLWYHSTTCGNSNSTARARIGSSADREFYPLHLQLRATSNGVAFFVERQNTPENRPENAPERFLKFAVDFLRALCDTCVVLREKGR